MRGKISLPVPSIVQDIPHRLFQLAGAGGLEEQFSDAHGLCAFRIDDIVEAGAHDDGYVGPDAYELVCKLGTMLKDGKIKFDP